MIGNKIYLIHISEVWKCALHLQHLQTLYVSFETVKNEEIRVYDALVYTQDTNTTQYQYFLAKIADEASGRGRGIRNCRIRTLIEVRASGKSLSCVSRGDKV